MSQKRPKGLVILAIINFFFAALLVPTLLIYIFAPQSLAEADVDLNAYTILSPVITSFLLLISGIGFLRLSYKTGYIVGLIFAVGSLLNIVIFNALRGFQGFQGHIPSMIYPVVLILLLTLRYRRNFESTSPIAELESESAL